MHVAPPWPRKQQTPARSASHGERDAQPAAKPARVVTIHVYTRLEKPAPDARPDDAPRRAADARRPYETKRRPVSSGRASRSLKAGSTPMSSPPRTGADPTRAGPQSPSRDELMPQQPQRLPHTPARAATTPEPKRSRHGSAAPPAGDMETGPSVPADSLSPEKMQPLMDALAGTGDAQAPSPVQHHAMKLRSRPEPSANPQYDSDEDESHNTPHQPATHVTQMKVVKDGKGRKLVAFHDLGEQVATLASVPPQSASTPSVFYGDTFRWYDLLKLHFLYPVLWNSAHPGFLVTSYWKKGGDGVTAATEAVADACRPAFLNFVERTPGNITIAVPLRSGQKRTGGPVADLAKALADMRCILRRNRRRTRLPRDRRGSSSIASVTFDTTQ